jgi:hypothetical protein
MPEEVRPPFYDQIVGCRFDCGGNLDRPKKKDKTFEANNVYCHLGSASTLESLARYFSEVTGHDDNDIDIVLLEFYDDIPKTCNPTSRNFVPSKDLTVLVKKNPRPCWVHQILVIAIIVKRGIDKVTETELSKTLWSDLLTRMGPPKSDEVRGSLVNPFDKGCLCNKNDTMFTRSYGCTNRQGMSFCKFHDIPLKTLGRQKFKLFGGGNDQKLETFCHKVADILAQGLQRYAKFTYQNLQAHLSNTDTCYIGKEHKVFSGLSLVSYCAHQHYDANNYLKGCTAILSLHKENTEPDQKHYLTHYRHPDNPLECISFVLPSGSFLFEVANQEKHGTFDSTLATTYNSTEKQSYTDVNRVGLVAFSHDGMMFPNHSYQAYRDRPTKKENETGNINKNIYLSSQKFVKDFI